LERGESSSFHLITKIVKSICKRQAHNEQVVSYHLNLQPWGSDESHKTFHAEKEHHFETEDVSEIRLDAVGQRRDARSVRRARRSCARGHHDGGRHWNTGI